jgi:hypothetical protein
MTNARSLINCSFNFPLFILIITNNAHHHHHHYNHITAAAHSHNCNYPTRSLASLEKEQQQLLLSRNRQRTCSSKKNAKISTAHTHYDVEKE